MPQMAPIVCLALLFLFLISLYYSYFSIMNYLVTKMNILFHKSLFSWTKSLKW